MGSKVHSALQLMQMIRLIGHKVLLVAGLAVALDEAIASHLQKTRPCGSGASTHLIMRTDDLYGREQSAEPAMDMSDARSQLCYFICTSEQ